MKDLIKLQLRKSLLSFSVIMAALLASIPLALAVKSAAMKPGEAIDLAMLYWALVGIPLTALILSGIAGSEAARDQAASTEQPLPVSQYKLLLSSLAAVLLEAAMLTLAAWAIMGFSLPLERLDGTQKYIASFYLFSLVYLSVYGFTLSYAFRNGIAGAVLAAAAVAATVTPLVTMSVFQTFAFTLIPLGPLKPFIAVIALAGSAFALKLLSGISDRKVKRTAANMSLIALLLAAPALASLLALVILNNKVRQVTLQVTARRYFSGLEPYQYSPGADGLMLAYKPYSGEIFLINEDGGRVVVRPARESREKGFAYLFPDITSADAGTARDRDGTIWVLYGNYGRSARLVGGGHGGFTERASFEDWKVPELAGGKEPLLLDFRPDGIFNSPLPQGKKGLEWKKIGEKHSQAFTFLWKKYAKEGISAERKSDGKTIVYGKDSWTIAGSIFTVSPLPGFKLPGGTGFLVPTRSGNTYTTWLCRPGKKAEPAWPGWFSLGQNASVTPNGTVWGKIDNQITVTARSHGIFSSKEEFISPFFSIITPEGEVLPQISAAAILRKAGIKDGRLDLLRAGGGSLWFNAGDKYLVKADASDMEQFKMWKLPATATRNKWRFRTGAVSPTKNGILVAAMDGVYFMDWNGAEKKRY